MASDKLNIYKKPKLRNARLLLGFSGWMDGGEVSTGTVKCLIDKLDAWRFAEIEPKGFYIYSFPGSMEITSLFRPHTRIKNGLRPPVKVADALWLCLYGNLLDYQAHQLVLCYS